MNVNIDNYFGIVTLVILIAYLIIQFILWYKLIYTVMRNKNYDFDICKKWAIIGIFFGLVVYFMAKEKPDLNVYADNQIGSEKASGNNWKCPVCGKINACYTDTCTCGAEKN